MFLDSFILQKKLMYENVYMIFSFNLLELQNAGLIKKIKYSKFVVNLLHEFFVHISY